MGALTQPTKCPLPDPAKQPIEQELTVLLACCLWGEARGQHDDAKLGVGNVVRNRVLAGIFPGHDNWAKVITAPFQFSSFNANDANSKKILEPLKWDKQETWNSCYLCASMILNGQAKDNTMRATHYFDTSIAPPHWAPAFIHTLDIGALRFYRDPRAFRIHTVTDLDGEIGV